MIKETQNKIKTRQNEKTIIPHRKKKKQLREPNLYPSAQKVGS